MKRHMNKRKTEQNKTVKRNKKRYKAKLGTWNIRTMLTPGKIEEIGKEMQRYNVGILALQETRWKDEGIINRQKYSLLYAGEDKQGMNGTAFMLNNKFREKVMEFKKVNGRISYIRIKNNMANITILNVYAPTDGATDQEKEAFYEKIEEACETIPKHDTLIILGDLNAKIGKEDFLKDVAGKHTIHDVTNDNGIRLCNFAAEMNMYLASTKYKHRKQHKITWMLPGKTTGNQIDHVLISKKRERIIQDVRSYRGTSVDTDHALVIVDMNIRITDSNKNRNKKVKWNVDCLKNYKKEKEYKAEIISHLEKNMKTTDIEREWKSLKRTIIKSSEKVLRRRTPENSKGWFDKECEIVIKMKSEARLKWLRTNNEIEYGEYKQKRKEATKVIKAKKQEWIEEMMDEIEKDNKNNTKLYQYIRKQKNKKYFTPKIDKKNGKSI